MRISSFVPGSAQTQNCYVKNFLLCFFTLMHPANYVLSIINYKRFNFGRIQNYVQKYQNHDIIIKEKIII